MTRLFLLGGETNLAGARKTWPQDASQTGTAGDLPELRNIWPSGGWPEIRDFWHFGVTRLSCILFQTPAVLLVFV